MDIEEHISNLKQYIKDDEIIEKDESDFANFCKGHIDDIQAVLNELEKKEAEIDKLRNTNKDLLKKLRNRVKEVKSLTRYSLYKKEFARLNKQLKKKDTVIDLMANKLVEAHGWFYSEFDNYTKEDFKQYFYKKASEE